jgi:hypothetical protein
LRNGHINVQYVTQKGLEHFLVKYLSKIEPTFFGSSKNVLSEIDKHFQHRVVSSIEASSLIMGHHFVQSNLRVIYVDTSLPDKIFRFVKPKLILMNLEDEDDDIFRSCPLVYYFIRPQVSEREIDSLLVYPNV